VQRETDHDVWAVTRAQVGRPKCSCKQGLAQTIDTSFVQRERGCSAATPTQRELGVVIKAFRQGSLDYLR
jgi:hypothetical protein